MSKSKQPLALGFILSAICAIHLVCVSLAASTTPSSATQIAVAASCTVDRASTLDFGAEGALTANVDRTSTIQIQCSSPTPYSIGVDAGTGATVAVRRLTGPAATVNCTLYSDSDRTTLWGNTAGTDAEAAICNGVAQTHTVSGRATAQTTPAPGTSTATITVTVTY